MPVSSKMLLVEGDADTSFHAACLRAAGILDVEVGPPRDFSGHGTGKGNALTLFPSLIEGMEDGRITQLALVVDADYAKLGGLGYDETLKRVRTIVSAHGYAIPAKVAPAPKGHIFTHPDGLPNVGLWIMPDNEHPGFLEDFILASIAGTETKLVAHAKEIVEALPAPKFKDLHVNKAHVATWLAWQTAPGQGLHSVIGNKLINTNKGIAGDFIRWLKAVYRA